MNLKQLSDSELHGRLLTLKSKEDNIVAEIIDHLKEVQRRRLYADFKCASIYEYCIKILKYSNGDAYKKISAFRLSLNCDQVGQSIANGSLSLSNAASIQTFLNKSRSVDSCNSNENKINPSAIVNRVLGLSTIECEIELNNIAKEHNIKLPDQKPSRRRSGSQTMLKIYVDSEKFELLKSRLKITCDQGLIQNLINEKVISTEEKFQFTKKDKPSLNLNLSPDLDSYNSEVKSQLKPKVKSYKGMEPTTREKSKVKTWLESRLKPPINSQNKSKNLYENTNINTNIKTNINANPKANAKLKTSVGKNANTNLNAKRYEKNSKPRSISLTKKKYIYRNSDGKCSNCDSRFHLQIDHKQCVAKGGTNKLSNLRLLCRSCNQREGIHQLGLPLMNSYING